MDSNDQTFDYMFKLLIIGEYRRIYESVGDFLETVFSAMW